MIIFRYSGWVISYAHQDDLYMIKLRWIVWSSHWKTKIVSKMPYAMTLRKRPDFGDRDKQHETKLASSDESWGKTLFFLIIHIMCPNKYTFRLYLEYRERGRLAELQIFEQFSDLCQSFCPHTPPIP